jgi:hypothetical protein
MLRRTCRAPWRQQLPSTHCTGGQYSTNILMAAGCPRSTQLRKDERVVVPLMHRDMRSGSRLHKPA